MRTVFQALTTKNYFIVSFLIDSMIVIEDNENDYQNFLIWSPLMMILKNADITLLERARACAMEVRAYPRLDILKACQLISLDIDLLSSEMLEIFIRSLPEAFGRQVVIHNPGTKQLSWDEKWLLSIIEAVSRADYDSVHFLIRSAVKQKHRREFLTIAHELWKISA